MSVRPAEPGDVFHVATLGHRFIEAAGMPPASIEQCIDFCAAALLDPAHGCFVSEGGVIMAQLAPLYYRPDYLMAVEMFWWAEDRQGFALLEAFEDWADRSGAAEKVVSMLHGYSPQGLDAKLEARGYKRRDTVFRKEIAR